MNRALLPAILRQASDCGNSPATQKRVRGSNGFAGLNSPAMARS